MMVPRVFIDSKIINNLGWNSKISLRYGIELTYKDYLKS